MPLSRSTNRPAYSIVTTTNPFLCPALGTLVSNQDRAVSAVLCAGLEPTDQVLHQWWYRSATRIGGGTVVLVSDHELRQDGRTRNATRVLARQMHVPEPAAMHRRTSSGTVNLLPNAK